MVVTVQACARLCGSAGGYGCSEVAVGPGDRSPSALSYSRARAPPGGTLLDLHPDSWLLQVTDATHPRDCRMSMDSYLLHGTKQN